MSVLPQCRESGFSHSPSDEGLQDAAITALEVLTDLADRRLPKTLTKRINLVIQDLQFELSNLEDHWEH